MTYAEPLPNNRRPHAGQGIPNRLTQQGRNDLVVLVRVCDVGGTWRDYTYPGAACVVPSHLYS
ncbi:hypothetical protein, partial [Nocardia abscessus]|uniref:hypothetical protein n=1 Tax=Nocardia abscessus TaxID=120957 RepID=UPI003CC7EA74